MLRFSKIYDIRRVLENVVCDEDLIRAAFEDIPELDSISFSVTNEYDDNNYSDYCRLTEINGWRMDYDDNYDESDENESPLPKIEDKNKIGNLIDLVQTVGKDFGYNEDHKIDRAFALRRPRVKRGSDEKAELKYVLNHVMGKKLKENFFVKAPPKWALYHAVDHGRFTPEAEFKIFAKEGRMNEALKYAQEVLKGPLDERIENFFILNSQPDSSDYEFLKEYIEFKKNLN